MTDGNPMFQDPEPVEVPEILKEITNEDGTPKYASVEDGLKALVNAQEHIKTLESENSTFREDLSKRQTTEELLEQIKNQSQPDSRQDPSSNEGIDLASVAELVDKQLSVREVARSTANNQKMVVTKLQEHFGDKAMEVFIAKADELGLGQQTLEEISGKSPQAVLAYFELKPSTAVPKSDGTINTDNLQPNDTPVDAKVPYGANSKQLVNAWKAAGELVNT